MIEAIQTLDELQSASPATEVAEALAAVSAFQQSSDFAGMESDMRTLADKLTAAADVIREAERERRRDSRSLAGDVQTIREALDQHLAGAFDLTIADDEHGGATLAVNLRRRCGGDGYDPIDSDAVQFLRQSAGRLGAAASAIEAAFGESDTGVLLYEVPSSSREIYTTEFEDVRFFVDNVESEAEAVARVREVLAGLQAAGVAG